VEAFCAVRIADAPVELGGLGGTSFVLGLF
jgi:hypothetical protein